MLSVAHKFFNELCIMRRWQRQQQEQQLTNSQTNWVQKAKLISKLLAGNCKNKIKYKRKKKK